MIRRFQIEDLVAQDSSGVVFRALDAETGLTVGVRRFIPFGNDGIGLRDEERIAYEIAVGRLAGIHCPGLRSVITGGCDPVDGMPFIATEWIEGQTLRQHALRQPLTVPDVIHVLTRALEVCGLLSNVLAEEGVWVETELDAIVVGDEGGGRGVTFWISPWKWLGRGSEERGFSSIITLTEELMGWKDQNVGDQAGNGLGGWLKWLRGASRTASLGEVREMLAAATGMEPPVSPKKSVRHSTRQVVSGQALRKPTKKTVNGMMVTLILLGFVTTGLVAWAIFGMETQPPEKTRGGLSQLVAEVEAEKLAQEKLDREKLAEEMREVIAGKDQEPESQPADTPANPAPIPPDEPPMRPPAPSPAPAVASEVFPPDDPRLVQQDGHEVRVEGVFEQFGRSRSGETLYLLFSQSPSRDATRGSIRLNSAGPDLSEEALTPLIGKKIRLRGEVKVQRGFGLQRPDIMITRRADIEVVE